MKTKTNTNQYNVVYEIKNTITGFRYIGSTMNFNKRVSAHQSELRRYVHGNWKLQEDYRIFGSYYEYNVLFEFDTIEEARDKERELIVSLPKLFNMVVDNASEMKSKTLYLLDKNGNVINKFTSRRDAKKKTGTTVNSKKSVNTGATYSKKYYLVTDKIMKSPVYMQIIKQWNDKNGKTN